MRNLASWIATMSATLAMKVLRLLAIGWTAPAILMNVDWAGDSSLAFNTAAVGSILASAVFIEAAIKLRSWLMSPVFMLVGVFLAVNNSQVAFTNISKVSDHASDHARSQYEGRTEKVAAKSRILAARSEVAKVAGEQPPASYEALMQQKIAKDANRYRATGNCAAGQITAGPSMTFCSEIAALAAQKAAAEKRDELDGQLKALGAELEDMPVVTTIDPYADGVADIVGIFNVKLDDKQKRAITSSQNVTRALGLELIATFGPSGWLAVLQVGSLIPARLPRWPRRKGKQEAKPDGKREATLEDFERFVAETYETCPGKYVAAGDMYGAWKAWCEANGLIPGSQRIFGYRMKEKFEHNPNNGRPRYMNVRAKRAAPKLSVVAA